MGGELRFSADSPPSLLISGGLFFLLNNDPKGWLLILIGAAMVADAYRLAKLHNGGVCGPN